MKIAVDARELTGRPTGVGRYLAELLAEWGGSRETRSHDWRLYSHDEPQVPEPFRAAVRVLPGSGGTRWEQWTLPHALDADPPDVLFAPGYTAPIRARCPVVLTVHDVSFAAHPEWFRFREGARRRMVTQWSARRAAIVLTDSAFSRGEIVRHLAVGGERIRVIPLGIRLPGTIAPVTREPLVLFVGSLFTRRHVDALISAFASRVAPGVARSRLEIVGEDRSHPPVNPGRLLTLQPLEVQRRITIRSYVDDETLKALYAQASVFAFPSEYEGFGLTPLEALAAGVPPVVLDTPIATEIYGPAAYYVPATPPLTDRLGEALIHVLTSETARNDVLQHAPAVLARYRWDRTAAATFDALVEAARG